MSETYQVVIVGGGPVGLGLAVTLGLRGIRCVVLERRVRQALIPKGQNLTQRTLEHFYFWGIVDQLRAARTMPKDAAIGEVTAYGNLASDYWQAPPGREVVRKFYFQDNDRLPQYRMEDVLTQKLRSLPNVSLKTGWTVTGVAQDDSGVRITARNEAGEEQVFAGDYAVGCDGGHSFVREAVGIARAGTDFDQPMLLTVFRSKELHEKLQRFPQRSVYRAMHPDLKGYWQFFGRIDVGEGWFFHAPVPPDTKTDEATALAVMRKATGFDFAASFDHIGLWDLRVSVAENYQVGRVFIAGDAAHSHPPYGAFGVNNGLEDAVNLGWKLAAALQGWGGAGLLASYSAERRPIFKEVAEDFIATRIRKDAEFLARYSPKKDKAEFEAAWNARYTELGNRAQVYEPHYDGSPVIVGPPGGVSSAHGQHMMKARPGHHLTPQPLSSGRNVFEELGPELTMFAFDADDAVVATLADAAKQCAVPLKIVRDDYAAPRAEYEERFILVRPDQFIAWTGDRLPDDCAALLRRVTGH